MRIALGIVSLFAGGGLQRDCIEIARLLRTLGHEVAIYTCRIRDGILLDDVPIVALPNGALTNHRRQYRFAVDFLTMTSGRSELAVGFDKLLGLDLLYCADPSMKYRVLKQPYLGLLPRYRTFCKMERDSFLPRQKTKIILLSHSQFSEYRSAWSTERERLTFIAPTLAPARRQPQFRASGIRQDIRAQLNLRENDWTWISIAVQPVTKGIDRTIEALTRFSDARLLIVGLNETDDTSAKLVKRTRNLGLAPRIQWLGHREDIPHLMAAADLLVHPARYDTTGTVILEAIVNGLPVVTSAACGYARHVDAAYAGLVVKEPFDFQLFVAALDEARDPDRRAAWSAAGAEYGKNPSLYQGRMQAAQIISEMANAKARA